jgi:hypothetical protein
MHAGAKINAEHMEGPARVVAGEKAEQPDAQGMCLSVRELVPSPDRIGLGKLTIAADAGFSRHPSSGSSSSFTFTRPGEASTLPGATVSIEKERGGRSHRFFS